MKRIQIALVSFLILGLLLSSAPNLLPIVSAQEPVTIWVMTQDNELSDEDIAEFEAANPDIQIEFTNIDGFNFDLAVATGDMPDVVRVNSTQMFGLVAGGYLLDLTSYFESSSLIQINDIASAADYFRFNERYYGLPKDWSPDFTVWISNAAFEAAGIPIPDTNTPLTYAELADLADALTVRDGDTIVKPGLFIPNQIYTITQILIQHNTSMFNDDYTEMQLTQNPVAMEVTRFFYDMSLAGNLNLDYSMMGKAWEDGLPMIQWGYWYGGSIAQDSPLYGQLTMLPAPTWNHDLPRVDMTGGPVGLAISASSSHPDEAYRFFEWYIVGTKGQERTAGGWGAPPLKSMFDLLPQDTLFDQQRFNVLNEELQFSNWQLPNYPHTNTVNVFNEAWQLLIHQAVAGEIDFETFASNLQEIVNLSILSEQTGK